MTATARIPWHPPLIFEIADHAISPPAGKLKMRVGHNPYPKGATWQEIIDRYKHDLKLNKEAQDRWRNKDPALTSCTVDYADFVTEGLVRLGQIQENERDDSKIVGEALSEIIAEWLAPEAVTELLRQAQAKRW